MIFPQSLAFRLRRALTSHRALFLIAALMAAGVSGHAVAQTFTPIRVNAGGPAYTDSASNVWSADTGFNTGSAASTSSGIAGTSDPTLYQTNRWDDSSAPELAYAFTVPNGSYEVRLHFAETYSGAFTVGARVFDVVAEGATVLSNLDVYAQAGANAALMKSVITTVADGVLNIGFVHRTENPFVSAIEILAFTGVIPPAGLTAAVHSQTQLDLSWVAPSGGSVVSYDVERCQGSGCTNFARIVTTASTSFVDSGLVSATTYRYRVRANDGTGQHSSYTSVITATTRGPGPVSVLRVNAGGSSYTDSSSRVWSGDTGYNTGATTSTSASISGTADPTLYQTNRYDNTDAPELQYAFSLANGSYEVRLHFAETWSGAFQTGKRVFNVQVEGSTVISNLDVYAAAGANAALVRTVPVQISDGQLNIGFVHVVENPIINAIEVLSVEAPDSQPPSVPGGITPTPISSTAVHLAWTVSTDDAGVAGYSIERCAGTGCTDFAVIGTPNTNAYDDTGLNSTTLYRYRLRALDVNGNYSAYSSIVSTTPQGAGDTQAPTAPSGLTAITASPSQIEVTWFPSTDDVGVSGYLIERCQGAGCSSFAQVASVTTLSFVDSGLTGATPYRYRIRASDFAGNLSAYSSPVTASTQVASGTAGATTLQYDSFGRLKQITVVPN